MTASDHAGRWLAVDPGSQRIGLAVSDPGGTLASPHGLLSAQGRARDAMRIVRLAEELKAVGIVVGLPLNTDGSAGEAARLARRLAEAITRQTALPVELVDERLSSWTAEGRLREAGVRPDRLRARIDAEAAAVILQSWLDGESQGERVTPAPPPAAAVQGVGVATAAGEAGSRCGALTGAPRAVAADRAAGAE